MDQPIDQPTNGQTQWGIVACTRLMNMTPWNYCSHGLIKSFEINTMYISFAHLMGSIVSPKRNPQMCFVTMAKNSIVKKIRQWKKNQQWEKYWLRKKNSIKKNLFKKKKSQFFLTKESLFFSIFGFWKKLCKKKNV